MGFQSNGAVYFQRLTVIITEVLLYYACHRYFLSCTRLRRAVKLYDMLFSLVAFNAGIIMVDNIHFQYNGMLLGLLVLIIDY